MDNVPGVTGNDSPESAGEASSREQYFVPPGVDPRISLANERTFLAWIRTSLGFMVAGVALAQVLGSGQGSSNLDVVGAGLVLFGAAVSVLAHRRWDANERRFAARLPLERSRMPGMLTSLMVIVAAAAILLTLWFGR